MNTGEFAAASTVAVREVSGAAKTSVSAVVAENKVGGSEYALETNILLFVWSPNFMDSLDLDPFDGVVAFGG